MEREREREKFLCRIGVNKSLSLNNTMALFVKSIIFNTNKVAQKYLCTMSVITNLFH